jgi:hypothetical protein
MIRRKKEGALDKVAEMNETKGHPMLRSIVFTTAAAIALHTGAASACADTAQAKIKSFECGDNCYLTITNDKGSDETGLCTAEVCQEWNTNSAMPDEMVGRTIEVKMGVGKQYDSAGNLMGESPSFEKILFTTP